MKFKSLSPLQIALAVSVAAHAALLAVRFVDPERFNRVFQDTPLEVVLVNSRTTERPDKAQAIAQATLTGGGEAQAGRATSPLPPSVLSAAGDASEESHRRLEAMQTQQMMLLAQARQALAALPPPDPKQAADHPEARAREEKRRQLAKLLAEIERRINDENARPRKRYVSPATREEVYALYYDGLRRRIEERGTRNFPEAGGQKLYGELTVALTINHDGRPLSAEVVESSGQQALDRRAIGIATAAGPFGKFSEGMRLRAEQIVVVSRFRFTRNETLETSVAGR